MDYLPMIVNSTRCVQGRATFEDLDQPFGFVQYSYKLTKNVAKIQGDGIHDFGYVFVNGRHVVRSGYSLVKDVCLTVSAVFSFVELTLQEADECQPPGRTGGREDGRHGGWR